MVRYSIKDRENPPFAFLPKDIAEFAKIDKVVALSWHFFKRIFIDNNTN